MSWLLLGAAATGAWMLTAKSMDLKQRLAIPQEIATEDRKLKRPLEGLWQDAKKVIFSSGAVRGNFRSVQPSIDARGAKIYITTYADGAKTILYHDPRVQL